MRLAIIDLGTNSVRFDVHEIGPDNEVYRLHREKLMIRLGEGVFLKKRLNRGSTELCVTAFKSFQRTMKDFKVNRVIAFGTAALREAKDSERLIRRLFRETGIQIRIIPGEEEARLIGRGVLANDPDLKGSYTIVDIGGGSTEVVSCRGRKMFERASFELGTARLQQIFLKSIPPVKPKSGLHSLEILRRHIRGTLLYKIVSEDWSKTKRIVASSGTAKALLKIIKKRTERDFIDRKSLRELVVEMSTMSRSELLTIPGMEHNRVDMILAGAILLEECMNAFQSDEVITTEFSLRDGILDEQIEILAKQKKHLRDETLDDLVETAKDLGARPDEIYQATQIAELLFDRLRSLHKLSAEWKIYLIAGAILQDCGRSISAIGSHQHSAYVARYADVPKFENWESDFISELCFYAKSGKIQKKDLPFRGDKRTTRAFYKLVAILRLVTALSFQRARSISIERLKIEPRRVTLSLSKRSQARLALLRADQKRNLFEEVFKRSLFLEMA